MTTLRGGDSGSRALNHLARQHGVQRTFRDGTGARRAAADEAVVAALRALGVPILRAGDATEAARAERLSFWRTPLEPVVTVWRGQAAGFELRTTADKPPRVKCTIDFEDAGSTGWTVDVRRCRRTRQATIEGEHFAARRLALPQGLPLGYHTLRVEHPAGCSQALVIVAPLRAFDSDTRGWGAFLPTYALHTADSWGIGDLTDVERVVAWLGSFRGGMFSTVPLLAAFLGRRPFDSSPYAPASRLFWNEVYVDPRRTPEFARSRRARELVGSATFAREIATLNRGRLVDYRRVMRLKRRVLALLASELVARHDARSQAFRRVLDEHPVLERYAAFRASCDRQSRPWPEWPARVRDGDLQQGDYDPVDRLYHGYAQWVAAAQVTSLSKRANETGPGLYLDMPVGVHPHSYDVWAYRDLFAKAINVGAPRDALFPQGQDWGFPPLHPEAIRRDHYRYVRAVFSHVAVHARTLRLDHVMALHRLYWIPAGFQATEGVYVHYRSAEAYAVLTLESHRHRLDVVGENLGTVPPAVNRAMDKHGLRKLYVLQFEIRADARRPLRQVQPRAVASVNTHDVPTFAAYFAGLDIDTSLALGWLSTRQAAVERRRRRRLRRVLAGAVGAGARTDDRELLRRVVGHLGRSAASLVVVNLEDLWGETAPQNLPGTGAERPNWRRKARLPFETFRDHPAVVEILRELAALRPADGAA